MKKRLISVLLAVLMIVTIVPLSALKVEAASRYEVNNNQNVTGQDIVDEARKWANSNAVYWSNIEPWQASIYWRTGYTYQGQTSFDCSGFVARILNDCGFRGKSYTPSYGTCILSEKYGAGYIGISIEDLVKYGTDITAAVNKAKYGDYSDLQPGDIIGWTSGSLGRHIIIYAGLQNGTPWMVEFTGNGYYDRAITASYQNAFQYGARFAEDSGLYLELCTKYPSSVKLKITEDCCAYTQPCNNDTAESHGYVSTKLTDKPLSKGVVIDAMAVYQNTEGHYWYRVKLPDGTNAYLYSTHCEKEDVINPTIENGGFPESITGATSLQGTITTSAEILMIQAYVYKGSNTTSGTPVIKSDWEKVGTGLYPLNGSVLDNTLLFQNLASSGEGYYTLTYEVLFSSRFVDNDLDGILNTWNSLANIGNYTFYYGSMKEEASSYTVTFNANGGSCSTSTKTVAAGTAIGTLPTATREGYTFAGWYTEISGGSRITESSIFSANTAVYARWTGKSKTVTMYNASGTVWKTISCAAGEYLTLTSDYPTVSGSYFSGWAYTDGASVFDVRPNDIVYVSSDISLYPVYVTHTQAISGAPVLIYNISDFTADNYNITTDLYQISKIVDTSYWTDWSDFSITKITADKNTEVKTTAMYRYYYYLCSSCGAHEPYAGDSDCGAKITSANWNMIWSTVPYSQSNYKKFSYTTQKYYTTSLGDNQIWIFSSGNLNHTSVGTKDTDSSSVVIDTGYSYRTYVEQYENVNMDVLAYVITEKEHSHSYTASVSAPTCTTQGYTTYTCTSCGDSYKSDFVDASGHIFGGWYQVVAPTCTSNGLEQCDCNNCDYYITREIVAHGHSYNDMVTAPTCTAQGYTTHTCWVCGDSYKDTYINSPGHNYSNGSCTRCGEDDPNYTVDTNAPTIMVNTVNGRAGETITVSVTIKNNPGFGGMAYDIQFNETILELVSYEIELGNGICTDSGVGTYPNKVNFQYAGTSNITGDGVLVTLTFKIKDSAPEGMVAISIVPEDGTFFTYEGRNEKDFDVNCIDGGVEVVTYVSGDINGDGKVNNRDAARLLQKLAGWDVEYVDAALDVNGDGKVNNRDAARILQYLAGWDVELH